MATRYVDGSLPVSSTSSYDAASRNTGGSDGNAYQTWAAAYAASSSGDTILWRSGTYFDNVTAPGSKETCFLMNAAKDTTVQAYPGETPVLTYPAGDPPLNADGGYGAIVTVQGTNTRILDGLKIIGTRDAGDSPSGADEDINVLLYGTTGNVTLRNCTFRKYGHAAVKNGTMGGAVTIEQNLFEAGGFTGRDHHIYWPQGHATYRTTVRYNAFTGAAGYALHLYGSPQNVDVYGNLIFANGALYAPIAGGGILLGGSGHRIYSNTIYGNLGYGGIVFWKSTCTLNEVKNNIVRGNVTGDFTLDQIGIGNAFAYNNTHLLWTNNGLTNYDGSTGLDVDPLFVSASPAAWADFRLQSLSPMARAGAALALPGQLDPREIAALTAYSGDRSIGAFAMLAGLAATTGRATVSQRATTSLRATVAARATA